MPFKLTDMVNYRTLSIVKIVSIFVYLFLQLYRTHRDQGQACFCKNITQFSFIMAMEVNLIVVNGSEAELQNALDCIKEKLH